jgi:hypothetical protein
MRPTPGTLRVPGEDAPRFHFSFIPVILGVAYVYELARRTGFLIATGNRSPAPSAGARLQSPYILRDPDLDSLRGEPQFESILDEIRASI